MALSSHSTASRDNQSQFFFKANMSSGFVSGGTADEPIERDDEWQRVQQELEEQRKRKADIGKQEGGQSLYDVLQNNKSELHHH